MAPRARPSPLQGLACFFAITVAASGCTGHQPERTGPLPGGGRGALATVTHVVDGDTVDIRLVGGQLERTRLLGVDTPETVKPNTPVECFGPEASARTKSLLPAGTRVLLQRDAEARDRYGRLLAYLWRASDGVFVNRALLRDGYARILSIEPNTAHRADFATTASEARSERLGLWEACPASG